MKNQSRANELPRRLLNVIARFNENDKKVRNFGTDTALHLSEIHLIELIGDHADLCVSEIAREKEVTKGAVSQTLRKLEEKEFIRKGTDPENRTRVVVSLTQKGRTAYAEHKKYHERIAKKVLSCVQGLTDQEVDALVDFLSRLEQLF